MVAVSESDITAVSSVGPDLALCWDRITYAVSGTPILNGLSGTLHPRRALAIMGSSGAGKTTLLNAIGGRLANDSSRVLDGAVAINDVAYDSRHRRLIGFVPQDDILSEHSTPSEALAFSHRIRCGADRPTTTHRVNAMLTELQLLKCRDGVVGAPGLGSGISGGERKRVNIGQDSAPRRAHQLARRGRTVAFTIHQPTRECFDVFDDLLLLVSGSAVYHGPAVDAVDYFTSVGFECPGHYTPSDYFMKLMQDDVIGPRLADIWNDTEPTYIGVRRREIPCSCKTCPFDPSSETAESTEQYLDQFQVHGASYVIQLVELFKRSAKAQLRNTTHVIGVFVQAVIFGVICALIFMNLTDDSVGVADRHGLFFTIVDHIAFASVEETINVFPPERALFLREQQTGADSPLLFFCAKTLAEVPITVAASIISAVLIYILPTGLALDAGAFITFTTVIVLLQQVGSGIGLCISIGIENLELASAVSTMFVMPSLMAGGFIASTERLRPTWVWLEKTSYIRWAYVL